MINNFSPQNPAQAEAVVPLRLPLWLTAVLLLFPLAGQCATANLPQAASMATTAMPMPVSASATAPSTAPTPAIPAPTALQQALLTRLTRAAQEALARQIQAQHWEATQSAVQAWLPAGSAHLPPCRQAVSMTRSNPAAPVWGRQNYLLQCADQPGWRTRGEVRVTLTLPVWVAARGLDKQQALSAADLQAKVLDVTDLRRSFTPIGQSLLGYRTLRRVNAGELLSPDRLGMPLAVHKGDPVMIYARQAGFSASARGEADADGSVGDIIAVHNLATGKRVRARISADHEVETRF